MENWGTVFGSYLNSGVYMLTQGTEADIRSAARANGLEFLKVDLKGVRSKTGFLKKTARSLGFPAYFGMNWDAFSDCLTDMAWKPAAGYVILFNNHQSFASKALADAQVAGSIFDSSAQYWKHKKMSFYIVLREETS